jgi:hypothetical protein
MFKKTALIALSIVATGSMMANITKDNLHDFAKGFGLGAVHGLFNKITPSGAQPLTFVVAACVQDELTTRKIYSTHEPVAIKFGHALGQGLVEGSSYDHATKTIRPGFSVNLMSLITGVSYLYNKGVFRS